MRFTIITFLLAITIQAGFCQVLPSPVFTNLPNCASPGTTITVGILPDTSVTSYTWSTNPGNLNALLFNGQIGPLSSTDSTVNATIVLSQLYHIVCVTAYSACCSSATVCDTLFAVPPIQFSPLNDTLVAPGTSGIYSITNPCSVMHYIWTVTGDVTINNSGTSETNGDTSVTLNFGPSFTTGTLCVQAVTTFGLATPITCMPINAPTSIEDADGIKSFYFDNSSRSINIEGEKISGKTFLLEIIDAKGTILKRYPASSTGRIMLPPFSKGVYVARITGKNMSRLLKFTIR